MSKYEGNKQSCEVNFIGISVTLQVLLLKPIMSQK